MEKGSNIQVIKPDHLNTQNVSKIWTPGAAGLPKGFTVSILQGDPEAPGLLIMQFNLPAHYKNEPHFHYVPEHVMVLSGTMYEGEGFIFDENQKIEMSAGTFFVIPAKVPHYTWTKEEEASILIITEGPWKVIRERPVE